MHIADQATNRSDTPANSDQDDLGALYPGAQRDNAPEDPVDRLRHEYLAEREAVVVDRAERSRDRLKQTALEFVALFVLTHWLFHGLTIWTFALNLAFATALAWVIERWYISRYPATFLALLGYGFILNCTAGMSPTGLIGSVIIVTCGTQMMRITREAEWQGA